MSEWISVKDRLPELEEENGAPRPSKKILLIVPEWGIILGWRNYKGWSDCHGTACGCCSEDFEPTHWIPLPELPK
jgi:hypothetical protein